VPQIDFALSAGGYFVVLAFGLDTAVFQQQHDIGPQVLQRIDRGHRQVALAMPNLIASLQARPAVPRFH
jgi:hypothetical protein